MSCNHREKNGVCSHYQCPYSKDTGYDCVDVFGDFCEVGDGCLEACSYSWPQDRKKDAVAAFEAHGLVETIFVCDLSLDEMVDMWRHGNNHGHGFAIGSIGETPMEASVDLENVECINSEGAVVGINPDGDIVVIVDANGPWAVNISKERHSYFHTCQFCGEEAPDEYAEDERPTWICRRCSREV